MEVRAVTSAFLCVCLLFVSAEQKNITAVPGQTVTLPCRAPDPLLVPGVEWSRRDLEAQYVLWFWEKQFVPELQHPSFKNRVDLQDRQMKDGDVSLILKNVMVNDTGTYECYVLQEERDGRRIFILKGEPVSITHLRVLSPGPGGLWVGFVGLLVFILVFLVCCSSLIKYTKKTERTKKAGKEKSPTRPASSKWKWPTRSPTHPTFCGRKTEKSSQ